MTDAIIFIMIMCFMFGFLFGGMFGRHKHARAAYKQGLYDGKVGKLLNCDNWFDDVEDFRKLKKILKEE